MIFTMRYRLVHCLFLGRQGVRGISPYKQILTGFRLRKVVKNLGYAYAYPVLAMLAGRVGEAQGLGDSPRMIPCRSKRKKRKTATSGSRHDHLSETVAVSVSFSCEVTDLSINNCSLKRRKSQPAFEKCGFWFWIKITVEKSFLLKKK